MNKVSFGLKNVHLAVITETLTEVTYGTPVHVPGAVDLVADPVGEPSVFRADDMVYWRKNINDGYDGTLQLALVPDSILKDVFGHTEDANGALFENADADVKKVALMFEFDGDAKKTRHIFPYVTLNRPGIAGKTKEENIEVQPQSMAFVAEPHPFTKMPKGKIYYGQTGYSTFFNDVYVPQTVTTSLSPTTATFSKAAPANVVLTVTSSAANTISYLAKDSVMLTLTTQYTVAELVATIPSAYLATLDNGAHTFTVVPAKGLPVSCVVTVAD